MCNLPGFIPYDAKTTFGWIRSAYDALILRQPETGKVCADYFARPSGFTLIFEPLHRVCYLTEIRTDE